MWHWPTQLMLQIPSISFCFILSLTSNHNCTTDAITNIIWILQIFIVFSRIPCWFCWMPASETKIKVSSPMSSAHELVQKGGTGMFQSRKNRFVFHKLIQPYTRFPQTCDSHYKNLPNTSIICTKSHVANFNFTKFLIND